MHYVVTGRRYGQDEDTLLVLEAADADAAARAFRRALRGPAATEPGDEVEGAPADDSEDGSGGCAEDEATDPVEGAVPEGSQIYVTHVVRCPGARPVLEWGA